MLSFFRGAAGKSPDLSSQKRETLRGADSAYYQVGQTGKEGTESQGTEPPGVLKETRCTYSRLWFTHFNYVPYSLEQIITAKTRAFPLLSSLSVVEWKKHDTWRVQLGSDVIAITYCVVESEILSFRTCQLAKTCLSRFTED